MNFNLIFRYYPGKNHFNDALILGKKLDTICSAKNKLPKLIQGSLLVAAILVRALAFHS